MPNYSLVANSTFQPLTYQEIALPLDRQEALHENLLQQMEQLSDKADILEAMGRNDRDSKAYSQYKAYSDHLREEADNLYRNGLDLNGDARMRVTELRRRYNQEVVPIQNAWNKREQEAEMQMKARMANPSLRFTRDAANSSLDEYIANPTGGYGVVNLDSITAQMAGMAKNLTNEVRGGAHKDEIDAFTFDYIRDHGVDSHIINQWLQNPNSNPALTNMMNQVLAKNGITAEALQGSSNAANLLQEGVRAAQMGAWEAIGKPQSQVLPNWKARQDYEFNQQMQALAIKERMEMQKAAMKAALEGNAGLPNVASRGVGLVPTEQYKAENMKVLETLKGGKDGFKAKYFGSRLGQVNPMRLYEEVKAGNSKEAVLNKYRKYGVTDILSKDQYEAMKSLGYEGSKAFASRRHSEMMKKFDELVEQRTSYSPDMMDYESFNDIAIPNLLTRDIYNKGVGTVWKMKDNGDKGNPASVKDLNLNTKDNTKGNKITDVRYDPRHKGKIVLQLSDGQLYIADPSIYSNNLANIIADAERNNAPAHEIAAAIGRVLNSRNKVKSKTDSKIE